MTYLIKIVLKHLDVRSGEFLNRDLEEGRSATPPRARRVFGSFEI